MVPWALLDTGKSRFKVTGCLYCFGLSFPLGSHMALSGWGCFPLLLLGAQGCFQTLTGWAESLPCSKLGLPRYLAQILESSV